jgi:hypothetical protein
MKTIDLILKDDPEYIQPEDYLRAAGESLFLMLVIGAITSMIFVPEVFKSNPILERMGYNNFCVGFDMAPATYFAFPFGILYVYFSMQFSIYDRLRTVIVGERLVPWKKNFSIITNNIYILSIIGLPLLLLVSPMVSIWAHSLLFLQIVVVRALVVLANFFEHPNPSKKYSVYVYIYILFSIAGFGFAVANYVNYDNLIANGANVVEPLIPINLARGVDYFWFFLMFLQSIIAEPGEKIYIKYNKVIQF